jgi:cyclopropane fatty-acyl-phospholipid synthase-like methyltransferase
MTKNAPFTGLFLETLHRIKTPQQTKREAEYLESLLELPKSAHLLDVPCGNGRIALALAERGFTLTGVDTAVPFLDRARAGAEERQLTGKITIHERDMRDLPWENEFDGAYCFWESFGYFDDAGNRQFLEAVAKALKPGGRFVFDTQVAETLLPTLRTMHWEEVDDDLIVMEKRDYDYKTSLAYRQFVFVGNGQIERSELVIRLYTYRELMEMVKSAGFSAIEDYSWLSLMPFLMTTPRLVVLATK